MRPLLLALMLAGPAFAQDDPIANRNIPESATVEEGLAAFDRIYAVASHPRCANP